MSNNEDNESTQRELIGALVITAGIAIAFIIALVATIVFVNSLWPKP